MKNIAIILLTFFAFSCNGQDICTYSQRYVDSVINQYEFKLSICEEALNINEALINADTFSVQIYDDRLIIEVDKHGYDVWVNIIDGNKRINTDYINFERKVLFMDDSENLGTSHTVGSIMINSESTKGSSYINLE